MGSQSTYSPGSAHTGDYLTFAVVEGTAPHETACIRMFLVSFASDNTGQGDRSIRVGLAKVFAEKCGDRGRNL